MKALKRTFWVEPWIARQRALDAGWFYGDWWSWAEVQRMEEFGQRVLDAGYLVAVGAPR
jgi:hypothetical protein